MNLVGDTTLGRIVVLSIWQCNCIIKSAASAYASMNLLIWRLPNRDEYHSYPAKDIHDWKFWGYLGQAFCKPDEPKSTDKYPSLNISGYIYSVKGEPLTEYWLPRALTTLSENLDNLDPVSKYVPVRNQLAAVALLVVRMGNIVGCVHVIPELATNVTGDRQQKRWIVDRHIDLAT